MEQDIVEVVSKFVIAVVCMVYRSVVHQINLIDKFIIIIVPPCTTNENKLNANEYDLMFVLLTILSHHVNINKYPLQITFAIRVHSLDSHFLNTTAYLVL